MKNENVDYFEGFDHSPDMLSAYVKSFEIFIIALKDGHLIRHVPEDRFGFENWLQKNRIRDINGDVNQRNTSKVISR